jgi:hypothetical protein
LLLLFGMEHFIRRISLLLISVPLFLLAACSSVEVNTAKAPNVDLARYKTYAWAPSSAQNKPQASILDQEIQFSVDRQLREKGFSPADAPASADVQVSYSLGSKTSYTYGTDYDGWDEGYWVWGGPQVFPVHEGILSIILVDPKSNKVVWSGVASDVIGETGESQQQITEEVKDLFKKYPMA